MLDIDALFRAARRKVHKRIERRDQIMRGKPVSTANRSAGQMYGRRGIFTKQEGVK